jgi:hypothetical protein
MENVLEKDITGHIGTQSICVHYYLRNGQLMDEPERGKTLA